MKKFIVRQLKKRGYILIKEKHLNKDNPDIIEKEFWDLYNFCKPYTMTSLERMFSLYNGVKYVLDNNIEGDFVECGVWRGGSSMLIAKMLQSRNITNRKLYMYDTYEGMSEPTEADKSFRGQDAAEAMRTTDIKDENSVWCYSSIDEVKNNMAKTGLAFDNIIMVQGKVEDTIPNTVPAGAIALLRLDTDWYESTYHELLHLYPKVKVNGVLIIDDYGHWEGCRKAVDEYFGKEKVNLLLNRIDYTGRMAIKTHN